MENLTLILISIHMALFVSSEQVISKELAEINKQIDQLKVGTSSFEDAVRNLGEPAQYLWGNKTFKKDNLPATFIAVWPDRVKILISNGIVHEIRFESPQSKYLFMGRIGIGSRLEDVLEVVGLPEEVIENEPIGFKDGILYRDVEGHKGACYYARSDKNVRMFFQDNKVRCLYLTEGVANTGSGASSQRIIPTQVC